ncbi:MAG: thiamine phosphate synthase [Akkermansiaceae bacterium]
MDTLKAIQRATLYGILDMGYVADADLLEVAKNLLEGGVDVLQLRAKGYSPEDVMHLVEENAPSLPELCRSFSVPFIINDFPEVALKLRADGLHIGQEDGELEAARKIVGESMIIGRSTHSLEQATSAMREGFDYIGFGPLFPTPTKKGRPSIGLDNISIVQATLGAKFPVFCIGGIVSENLELVLASGASRVVIVSALLQADDVEQATREVKLVISAA